MFTYFFWKSFLHSTYTCVNSILIGLSVFEGSISYPYTKSLGCWRPVLGGSWHVVLRPGHSLLTLFCSLSRLGSCPFTCLGSRCFLGSRRHIYMRGRWLV